MNRIEWLRNHVYGRIVDIGCHNGEVFAGMPNVTGLDLDTWSPPYEKFVQGDAANLPFKDGEFDCAVLAEILEHVADPVKVLKEARRVAKCVIISVPYEHNWPPELKPFHGLEGADDAAATTGHPECKAAVDNNTMPHLYHIRYYMLDSLVADIEAAGLKYKIEMLSYDGWCFFMGVLQ